MYSFSDSAKFYIYNAAINMRLSFEGLNALIIRRLNMTAGINGFFVFFNKRKDRIKVLYCEKDGFCIWYKRLEKGTYILKDIKNYQINRVEFFMLLEGITPRKIQKRKF